MSAPPWYPGGGGSWLGSCIASSSTRLGNALIPVGDLGEHGSARPLELDRHRAGLQRAARRVHLALGAAERIDHAQGARGPVDLHLLPVPWSAQQADADALAWGELDGARRYLGHEGGHDEVEAPCVTLGHEDVAGAIEPEALRVAQPSGDVAPGGRIDQPSGARQDGQQMRVGTPDGVVHSREPAFEPLHIRAQDLENRARVLIRDEVPAGLRIRCGAGGADKTTEALRDVTF